jgi:hypothetical protein
MGLGATINSLGMHIDDLCMDLILAKCAELRMRVNIHVGEGKWMSHSTIGPCTPGRCRSKS